LLDIEFALFWAFVGVVGFFVLIFPWEEWRKQRRNETMSEEKYKVCVNAGCNKYNIVVKTKWYYCPYCKKRLQYPVVTKMPKEKTK